VYPRLHAFNHVFIIRYHVIKIPKYLGTMSRRKMPRRAAIPGVGGNPQEAGATGRFLDRQYEVVGGPAHAFYDRLNHVLEQLHFDRTRGATVPALLQRPFGAAQHHAGVHFRSLLLGCFLKG
jgi:hypothetical protein